jgi:hypothetical protein
MPILAGETMYFLDEKELRKEKAIADDLNSHLQEVGKRYLLAGEKSLIMAHRILPPVRYTRHFNIEYRAWGHLCEGRYKVILCERDS